MKTITVRMEDQLLAAVDSKRGDVPRERWIRRTLEEALDGKTLYEEAGEVLYRATETYRCPSSRCDFKALSAQAHCPHHGRKVIHA